MLPSHLLNPNLKRNERPSHTRLGQTPPPPLPSLCVTGAMCRHGRLQLPKDNISLAYCIFRPRQLLDTRKPPLIVVHGGPSIPSNYLLPIVNGVIDRAVVFYDQWGCGKSSRPRNDKVPFSIDVMVDHLEFLLEHWKVSKFHLLGHSFGGIVSYEYLVKNQAKGHNVGVAVCESLILASTPTSIKFIHEECVRLDIALNQKHDENKRTETKDATDSQVDQEDQGDPSIKSKSLQMTFSEAFHQTHECRLSEMPLVLTDALAQAGPTSWRGLQAIPDYQASERVTGIPSLVLVGEYDFCTVRCTKDWENLMQSPSPQHKTLNNCSHYGMLEDEGQYGKAITEFLRQCDAGH